MPLALLGARVVLAQPQRSIGDNRIATGDLIIFTQFVGWYRREQSDRAVCCAVANEAAERLKQGYQDLQTIEAHI